MTDHSRATAWHHLKQLASTATTPLTQLIQDEARNAALHLSLPGILVDFSKQRLDPSSLDALLNLADAVSLADSRAALFRGEPVNRSEGRAVLHMALRDGAPQASADQRDAVSQVLDQMLSSADDIRSGRWLGYSGKPIRDVVHIGIGGSHLGPELAVTALAAYASAPVNIHFVANIDGEDLSQTLAVLNPETTLFVVVSKSFSTLETQVNTLTARSWFLERGGSVASIPNHFLAVTSNVDAAVEFGFAADTILPMWDWVGGRFSLWSAVGFPIALSLGAVEYRRFLAGAKAADEHFLTTPFAKNIPVMSALCATWNNSFLGAESLAMLVYDERLALLPRYLQQLEMESNGKSVTNNGEAVDCRTMNILWGGTGTIGQHAYHQLLHQGTQSFSADFIVTGKDHLSLGDHHDWLVANALAQSQAMAIGFQPPDDQERHRLVAGDRASTVIVLDELNPSTLGSLLALYEHKVFCQGVLWNINSFDQWGVELGKRLARPIHAALSVDELSEQDPSTRTLIEHIKKLNR